MANNTIRAFLKKRLEKKASVIPAAATTSVPTAVVAKAPQPFPRFTADDEDAYEKAPVGVDSIIGATKKLLSINRGEAEPDDRDSLAFKRVLNVDDLIAERARMDAGKLRNSIMFKLSNVKNLQRFPANAFDPYVTGHLISNSLALPSEEINPIYLLDQQRRVSVFGQGGIGSVDALSKESQNVNPSQFGFIDPIVGPDGMKAGGDMRLAQATRIGKKDGRLYTKVRDKRTGKVVWITPDELSNATVAFPD